MLATIKTFNGFNLNTGGYECAGLDIHNPPAVSPVFIEMITTDPILSGAWSRQARNLPITIKIHHADPETRWTLAQAMKAALQPGTTGALVVTMPDGVDYQMTCIVQNLTPENQRMSSWVAILQSAESTWRAVWAETPGNGGTWIVDASGDTKSITVNGGTDTCLSLRITPTIGAASGMKKQKLYRLVNVPGVNYGTRPWCITLDTTSRDVFQADAYDIQIKVGGKTVRRWIADPNTNHTKIWFNVHIGPGYKLTLETPVASSGTITELVFQRTKNNTAALAAMPNRGIIYHGTEWFQYSGKDLSRLALGVTKRGALGTAMAAHALAAAFYYIENPIYIVYNYVPIGGGTAYPDPATEDADYDKEKPVFNLSSSDNTAWVYDATHPFYDETLPKRPGSFVPSIKREGDVSDLYQIKENAASGDYAAGMLMSTWLRHRKRRGENATLAWLLQSAGGIALAVCTGRKYRSNTPWPELAGLQKTRDGKTWLTVFNEASPADKTTWTAIANTGSKSVSDYQWMRFVLCGGISGHATAAAYLEILTCTVTFTTATIPSGTILGESVNYPLGIVLVNNTTHDRVWISYPMLVNKTLVIDGENHTVEYDGVNAHSAVQTNDFSRDDWIRLNKGTNNLQITGNHIGTLSIDLSWYARQP